METADQMHRRIAADTGRTPSLQWNDETLDAYHRRMGHGLYSASLVNEMGREFGTFVIIGACCVKGTKRGREWTARCKVCGGEFAILGKEIRRYTSGKRQPPACKFCVTLAA